MRAIRSCLVLLLPVLLAACAGGVKMAPSEPPVMRAGDSMVVFMRPSALGQVVASSLYDVSGPDTRFVGILNFGDRLAVPVKPGKYIFMVIGESADFLQAEVQAGRTYYAVVTPRMGVWKARFSLRPVRAGEVGGSEFAAWNAATKYVTNSPQTEAWARDNANDIHSKRNEYWPQWSGKPANERLAQTLRAEDGVSGAPR
jgi:hypothetical protein